MRGRRAVLLLTIGLVSGALGALAYRYGRPPRGPQLAGLLLVASPEVDHELVGAIATGLARAYGVACAVSPQPLALPATAYDAGRHQYRATALRQALRARVPHPHTYVLGVTHADLFQPSLNFVFGEADLGGNVAVMSTARLYPRPGRPVDQAQLRTRATRIAIHELGHARGLLHCSRPECVMHFANSLGDLDQSSDHFCPRCEARLR